MVKRSVLGGANGAQAFATCRREASSCLGKTATRLVIKAWRLFPRTATRPVDQNHKLLPLRCTLVQLSFFPLFQAVLPNTVVLSPFNRPISSFSASLYPSVFPSACRGRGYLRLKSPFCPVRAVSSNLRKSTGYRILMEHC